MAATAEAPKKAPKGRKLLTRRELVAKINEATALDDPLEAHRMALAACGQFIAANDVTQALRAHLRVHGLAASAA